MTVDARRRQKRSDRKNTGPGKQRKTDRTKRPPRPPQRNRKKQNALRKLYREVRDDRLYGLGSAFPHIGDEFHVTRHGEIVDKPRGVKPRLPPEAYLLFEQFMGDMKCSTDIAEAYLEDPHLWDPIRAELERRFPLYEGLRPGSKGPNRRAYYRWKKKFDDVPALAAAAFRRYREVAVQQALDMGCFDDRDTGFTNPKISQQLIGDGTNAKSMFNTIAGELQYNPFTDEWEPIRADPDARTQYRKNDEDEIIRSDVAGTNYGMIHATTGFEDETMVLSFFHIPAGKGYSEANEALLYIEELVELIGDGVKGVMWDMAMRGKQIEQVYDMGVACHSKVAAAAGGDVKRALIESSVPVYRDGAVVGRYPIAAVGGQAHLVIDNGIDEHLVPLEHRKIDRKTNRSTRGKKHRWLIECVIPDDPRVPTSLRNGLVRLRLDTTSEDVKRNRNRPENLRPIHQDDDRWPVVGGPRSRAEALFSKVKSNWANGRIPAVGICYQMLRLMGIAMAINREAAEPPPSACAPPSGSKPSSGYRR